jgi:hypothetical protein
MEKGCQERTMDRNPHHEGATLAAETSSSSNEAEMENTTGKPVHSINDIETPSTAVGPAKSFP